MRELGRDGATVPYGARDNAQRPRNLPSGLTARRDGDTLVTKKEPTSMPNVYLHCTPKGRLTGRYKFDHGGDEAGRRNGRDPEGLTDQPEVDESILLARVTMAEGRLHPRKSSRHWNSKPRPRDALQRRLSAFPFNGDEGHILAPETPKKGTLLGFRACFEVETRNDAKGNVQRSSSAHRAQDTPWQGVHLRARSRDCRQSEGGTIGGERHG